jgi:hypothetical protein
MAMPLPERESYVARAAAFLLLDPGTSDEDRAKARQALVLLVQQYGSDRVLLVMDSVAGLSVGQDQDVARL